ncbi:DUF3135 domain-containing protein [Ferribacterium limneticum]|uniref:DUF3135 domain-containing protein n=1 Tax=Ferribacterium limneticum TaxID=76259 RepID=UPI001CFA2D94|nr:DUF3135 domain-containing protein [Ferribacterium limneticum]UCV17820.1 DUF3135 domain-containing protein [Ferribacterium limneticum]
MQGNDFFDFDLLAKLSADAPSEFAKIRDGLIQQAIHSFRIQEDGYRLQGEIDLERMSHAVGTQTCAALAYKIKDMVEQMHLLAEALRVE